MIYLTFIGNHDRIDKDTVNHGAVLTIFYHYIEKIDQVFLFVSPDTETFSYHETAHKIKRIMESEKDGIDVRIIPVELETPIDYNLVYKVMLDETQSILDEDEKLKSAEKIINITSGTPTMASCWVLLQQAGLIPNAKLVQSFEQKFQRKYRKTCQEVDLSIDDFPEIKAPNAIKRKLNRVQEELKVLKEEKSTSEIDDSIPGLIGKSKTIRNIKDQITHLINRDTHVLILGEPGTGKEVVAKAIWDIHRKEIDKELITFDCGQFEPNLIVSELFGHEKGSFTGASQQTKGIIEVCNGRMLYLDEIGNIPFENQGVFLRFLQFGEWKRMGSTKTNKSSIQVIAATNKDIQDENVFRADLRDRFHEIIYLPPLRERQSDIKLLVEYFLIKKNRNVSFTSNVYEQLEGFPWPGNVRQLEMWVGRICRKFRDIQLNWDDIPSMMLPAGYSNPEEYDFPDLPIDYYKYMDELRMYAIEVADGNKAKADRLLGLKEGTMKQWDFQRRKKKAK